MNEVKSKFIKRMNRTFLLYIIMFDKQITLPILKNNKNKNKNIDLSIVVSVLNFLNNQDLNGQPLK